MKKRVQEMAGVMPRYETRKISDDHWRSEVVADVHYQAEVSIDWDMVRALCNRAALNKGGRAKSGPCYVRMLERREVRR